MNKHLKFLGQRDYLKLLDILDEARPLIFKDQLHIQKEIRIKKT